MIPCLLWLLKIKHGSRDVQKQCLRGNVPCDFCRSWRAMRGAGQVKGCSHSSCVHQQATQGGSPLRFACYFLVPSCAGRLSSMINFYWGPEITFPLWALTRSQTQQSENFQRLISGLMHSTPPPARPGVVTKVQLWILHSVKETNRAKKRKKKRGVGGWEEGGEREEVPCGCYSDSRKEVQTHFADLVNNPCRVDSSPARNGFEPAAGFLFPLRQVQGSRPSRPPPLSATWEPHGTCAAPPRADSGELRADTPPRLFPAPLPSPPSTSFCSQKKKQVTVALLLSPQSEGETSEGAAPPPGAAVPRARRREPAPA